MNVPAPASCYLKVPLLRRLALGLLGFLLVLASTRAEAQQIPARPDPPRLVNDFAHLLMPSQVDALEQKLDAYNDSTSTQIAVVTVDEVGDIGMVDYAVKLGRSWGIGGKQFNNGVVLLISKNEHKAFIATGYGMEGPLPDARCKEIVDNDILPNFREQNYFKGLDEATDDIIAAAAGEYHARPKAKSKDKGGFFALFILILLLAIFFFGRGGGGGGTLISRRGWGIGPFLGAGLGAGLGASLGDWGGGSGGGFGGGGFGGFGGGSFGGGGAGGSW